MKLLSSGQTSSSIDDRSFAGQPQEFADDVFTDTCPDRLSMEKAVRKVLCCCGNCNLYDFLSRGCPSSGERLRKFPILDVNNLSQREKIKLIARLLKEYDRVVDEFASLVSETHSTLQKYIAVKEVKVYLCELKLSRFHANLVNKQMLQ